MQVTFKKATLSYSGVIIKLLSKLYAELGEEESSIAFLNEKLISDILNTNKTEIYLAQHDLEIVGIFTLTESQAIYAGGALGSIDEFYVLPHYRSKNVGKQMIDNIKEIASKKKWKRIDVTAPTEERWTRTVKF